MNEVTRFSIGGFPLPNTEHLSLGDRHPSQAGVMGVTLQLRGDQISRAEIQPGFLHRAAEKLFEVRDYRAAIMLADRHDWLSSFSGELVVTLSIENAMGLAAPKRAIWLRTLLIEYARIHSHLSYLSYLDETVWDFVAQMRTGLMNWSGNRVHAMLNRVGGLATEPPTGWLDEQRGLMRGISDLAERIRDRIPDRLRGLAIADERTCRDYGLTGPVARATGLNLDRRQTDPAYSGIFEPTPLQTEGDAHARFTVLADEVRTSATMVGRLTEGLPDGPASVRLARRLKVPEGEHISEIEAPWGTASVLLVSRGGQTPWRLALRTPTFANVSAMERLLVGASREQIPDAIASMGYAVGDLDK